MLVVQPPAGGDRDALGAQLIAQQADGDHPVRRIESEDDDIGVQSSVPDPGEDLGRVPVRENAGDLLGRAQPEFDRPPHPQVGRDQQHPSRAHAALDNRPPGCWLPPSCPGVGLTLRKKPRLANGLRASVELPGRTVRFGRERLGAMT